MTKPNGRQQKAIEGLAAALTECFDAAVEAGENRTRPLLEAQNETLRMIWRQCGGKEDKRLPIDE